MRVGRTVLVFLFLPFLAAAAPPAKDQTTRLEWAELPPEMKPADREVKFGYLVVPEDRRARKLRTIRLPFAILKTKNSSPRPDPVIFTTGGPGGSTIGRVRGASRNPILADRDYILFEQRGTARADPSLTCPEIDEVLKRSIGVELNSRPPSAELETAIRGCADRLIASGVNLAGYTTRESAADIEDLRRLLGIKKWNLYGVSYSGRLMATVIRDHPDGVRCAILDSPLPVEANWDEEAPRNIVASLDLLFGLCQSDSDCSSCYPDLRRRFYRFLSEANREPVRVHVSSPNGEVKTEIRLDGKGVFESVYNGLEDSSMIPRLPQILDRACAGEHQVLAPLVQSLVSPPTYAWGARLSVWANEEMPFENLKKALKQPDLPVEIGGYYELAVPDEAFDVWPRGKPRAEENRPVRSGIPVLITNGQLDPDTPPVWSQRMARHLRHAQLIEFPGYSHAPLFSHPASNEIIRQFLDDPLRPIDQQSIRNRFPIRFVCEPAGK